MKIKTVVIANLLAIVLFIYFFNSFFQGIEEIRIIAPRMGNHAKESWALLAWPLFGGFACLSFIATSFKAMIIKFLLK